MADLVLATNIKGLAVGETGNRDHLGKVVDVIIDGPTGRFLGLTFRRNFISAKSFISFADILHIDRGGVVIQHPAHIQDFGQVLKAIRHTPKGFDILGQPVITRSGKRLGRCEDVVISLVMGVVTQLHVRGFALVRVISADKVVELKPKKIIVENDWEEIPVGAVQTA